MLTLFEGSNKVELSIVFFYATFDLTFFNYVEMVTLVTLMEHIITCIDLNLLEAVD